MCHLSKTKKQIKDMGALMTYLFVHTNRFLINELKVSLGQLIHDDGSSIELSKNQQKYPKK